MKLQQLKYLLAIADNGLNISAAAERLFTSQPGVSKQLKMLEQELGLLLFKRKGKSLVGITAAGQQVIERARIVTQQIDNIKTIASDVFEQKTGELSIATTHTQARYVLPAVIKAFKSSYPEVNFNLHQGTSEQIAALVENHEVDFAIATGSEKLFSDLLLVPCYQWDRVVLVPKGHELATRRRKLTLEELVKYPLVTYVFSFSGESSLKKAFADQNLEPDVVFTARDADVIKTYVRMDVGVGIVASMAYEREDENDLTMIDATGLFPRSTTWIGFRKDVVLRRYMLDFMQLLSPQLGVDEMDAIAKADSQDDIDRLFEGVLLLFEAGTGVLVESHESTNNKNEQKTNERMTIWACE